MYDKLVAKVNNIDKSGFILKTKNDTDKLDLKIKNQWFKQKSSWYKWTS